MPHATLKGLDLCNEIEDERESVGRLHSVEFDNTAVLTFLETAGQPRLTYDSE